MKHIESKSYTLRGENGEWLGQIVLTTDGMFASVTDYGNLSFAWRSTGNTDFRIFMTEINVDYFATKLFSGMSYILHDRKTETACKRFAEKILPALQKVLLTDIQENPHWVDIGWVLLDSSKAVILEGEFKSCLAKFEAGMLIVHKNELASALY